MERRQQFYKQNSLLVSRCGKGYKRSEGEHNRKDKRSKVFDFHRETENVEIEDLTPCKISKRNLKLNFDKKRRDMKKNDAVEKPRPFVVGVVRHKIHSPPFLHSYNYRHKKQCNKIQSFAPQNYRFHPPKGLKLNIFTPISEKNTHSPFTLKSILRNNQNNNSQKSADTKEFNFNNITVRGRIREFCNDSLLSVASSLTKSEEINKNGIDSIKKKLWAEEQPIFGRLNVAKALQKQADNDSNDNHRKEINETVISNDQKDSQTHLERLNFNETNYGKKYLAAGTPCLSLKKPPCEQTNICSLVSQNIMLLQTNSKETENLRVDNTAFSSSLEIMNSPLGIQNRTKIEDVQDATLMNTSSVNTPKIVEKLELTRKKSPEKNSNEKGENMRADKTESPALLEIFRNSLGTPENIKKELDLTELDNEKVPDGTAASSSAYSLSGTFASVNEEPEPTTTNTTNSTKKNALLRTFQNIEENLGKDLGLIKPDKKGTKEIIEKFALNNSSVSVVSEDNELQSAILNSTQITLAEEDDNSNTTESIFLPLLGSFNSPLSNAENKAKVLNFGESRKKVMMPLVTPEKRDELELTILNSSQVKSTEENGNLSITETIFSSVLKIFDSPLGSADNVEKELNFGNLKKNKLMIQESDRNIITYISPVISGKGDALESPMLNSTQIKLTEEDQNLNRTGTASSSVSAISDSRLDSAKSEEKESNLEELKNTAMQKEIAPGSSTCSFSSEDYVRNEEEPESTRINFTERNLTEEQNGNLNTTRSVSSPLLDVFCNPSSDSNKMDEYCSMSSTINLLEIFTTPAKVEKTVTPAKVEKTVTPAKVEKTETPAKVEKTVTPAEVEKTVTPAKVEKTVTPAKVEKTITPAKVEKTITPAKVEKTVTPTEVEKTVTPAEVEKTVTPAKVEKTVTPAKVEKTITPAKVEKTITPAKVEKTVTPAEVKKTVTPVKVEKTVTPAKVEKTITPAKVEKTVTPAKVEKTVTPAKVEKTVTPAKVEKTVTPAKVEKTVTPAKVEKTVTPGRSSRKQNIDLSATKSICVNESEFMSISDSPELQIEKIIGQKWSMNKVSKQITTDKVPCKLEEQPPKIQIQISSPSVSEKSILKRNCIEGKHSVAAQHRSSILQPNIIIDLADSPEIDDCKVRDSRFCNADRKSPTIFSKHQKISNDLSRSDQKEIIDLVSDDEEDYASFLARVLARHAPSSNINISPMSNSERKALTPIKNLPKLHISPCKTPRSEFSSKENSPKISPIRILCLRGRNVGISPSTKKLTPRGQKKENKQRL